LKSETLKTFNGIVEKIHVDGAKSGPLAGTTFVAKDNFDIAGYKTTAGVPDWKKSHAAAASTAPAVSAVLAAGATLIGKGCMDELAFGLDGINVHFGVPKNPNRPDCIPGGSSSGSASAVAQGLCDFALGTDTAGSVRVPGAFCGILSMRPTHGRISIDGIVPLGPSFDTVGWFARDIDLFIKCGEVLLQDKVAENIGSKKICLVEDCLELLDLRLQQPFLAAVFKLIPSVDPKLYVTLPENSLDHCRGLLDTIRSWEAWQFFGKWLEETDPSMNPVVKNRFMNCSKTTTKAKDKAKAERSKVIEEFDELLENTFLCIPTTFNWPVRLDASDEEMAAHRVKNLLLNSFAPAAGLPQINLPISLEGHTAKFGLSLVGRRGSDTELLAIAKQLLK
jgi:amidase